MNSLNRLFSDKLVEILVSIVAYLFLIAAVLHSRSSEPYLLEVTLCVIGVLSVAMIIRGVVVMVRPHAPTDTTSPIAGDTTRTYEAFYSLIKPIAYITLITVILYPKISGSWVSYLLYLQIGLLIIMPLLYLFTKRSK